MNQVFNAALKLACTVILATGGGYAAKRVILQMQGKAKEARKH
jgi:H+/gluconate symporter-like permease